MKRNAFTFNEALVVFAMMGIIAAILFSVFGPRKRGMEHPQTCQGNLKLVALGIKQYIQDYDGKYPLVNSGNQGWMDILQPYLKSRQIFQCPQESGGTIKGTTDFFYNARLAGQPEIKLSDSSSTIMNGDGSGNAAANTSLTQLPITWKINVNFPAWRHKEGAHYAFADGRVKWFKPENVTNAKPRNNVTFAPW